MGVCFATAESLESIHFPLISCFAWNEKLALLYLFDVMKYLPTLTNRYLAPKWTAT
jgi:hypothetical protein